ncbi:hypothetical protein INR49_017945 [Caranx melampygus]|nr:hypothetical protein INR49_017945 [Caranx melampygus]
MLRSLYLPQYTLTLRLDCHPGRLSQNGSSPFEVTLNVINITLSSLDGSNIAVLHLETKPTLSDYIQPICLDNGQTFSVGTTCWAAGWNAERGGEQQVLQEFQTSVVDCGNTTAEGSICTGVFTLEQGDSGGPLMCKQGSSWFQAAVLSFENNSTSNSSTRQTRADVMVFTKLSEFQSFLSQTIGTFLSPASTNNGTNTTTTAAPSTTTSGGVLTHSPSLSFSYHLLILFMCLFLFS